MRINTEPVKEWFGYSRQERRSSIILLVLIAVVLLFRMFIPDNKMIITDLTPEVLAAINKNEFKSEKLFFNPNTASLDTLLIAGFDDDEAARLIRYRNKGGRFRKPADIRKLYGLDSGKASALIPYIILDTSRRQNENVKKTRTELNSCDSAALEKLPGLGPVLSARIIRYRNLLGGFVSVDQLNEVYGLNEQTFAIVKPLVYVDTAIVKKIMINFAKFSDLTRMPYLSRYQVNAILKYRELAGNIKTIDELRLNLILPDSTARKVSSYLDFSASE
ncbi:MAG TPA: helix-hairpin-helix domain-containing protein [Bacteroidales bacterium]|nr:helix-hairpin-helix domain-containing protein [Bacteroidales bacterium]